MRQFILKKKNKTKRKTFKFFFANHKIVKTKVIVTFFFDNLIL